MSKNNIPETMEEVAGLPIKDQLQAMNVVELTKQAFIALVGNEEKTWLDFRADKEKEATFYKNLGHVIIAVHHLGSPSTRYYLETF